MASARRHDCPSAPEKLLWVDDFLRPDQCRSILEELDFAFWEPSKLYVEVGERRYAFARSGHRVSSTTSERWFSAPLRRRLATINRRIGQIRPEILTRREEWQATRYAAGGRFNNHFDAGYFGHEPAGERTHTLLLYLDTPRGGGATRFPRLGAEVESIAGRLVIWSNLGCGGGRDPDMLHASRPLRAGRKTTLVTWIRQRGPPAKEGKETPWIETTGR